MHHLGRNAYDIHGNLANQLKYAARADYVVLLYHAAGTADRVDHRGDESLFRITARCGPE
jgi:hypothetical protein